MLRLQLKFLQRLNKKMKSAQDILKALNMRIKKILWLLGLHAFLLILFFIFVDFILGGFIFYKYVFLAEKEEPEITKNIIKFDYETYNYVLERLQAADQNDENYLTVNQLNSTEQSQNNLNN